MAETATGVSGEVMALVTQYGMNLVGAILLLIAGWIVAGWSARTLERALNRFGQVDVTLKRFAVGTMRYLVLILTGFLVLGQFGVETASLLALLGAAGLAVGLALQGTLSNVAAGVMLLILRPFKVGDYVEVAGHGGTVAEITLFLVELTTPDNVQISVPNSQAWGSAVKNYSALPTRRLDLTVGVAYEDDIGQALAAIREAATGDPRALAEPAPLFAVTALGESAVDITVRVWCNAGDYWPFRFDLNKTIKERLDAEGITIPFPQRVVHMARDAAE
jgi:small conductance mechanosensitive channel